MEVAAAISNAGGFGVYAAARDAPGALGDALVRLRRLAPTVHEAVYDNMAPTGLGAFAPLKPIASSSGARSRLVVQRPANNR